MPLLPELRRARHLTLGVPMKKTLMPLMKVSDSEGGVCDKCYVSNNNESKEGWAGCDTVLLWTKELC